MRFFSTDVLGNVMCGGQPGGRGDFTDVVVLFGTQEGAKLHRELVCAAIVAGNRLCTDFKRNPFNFKDADDLSGIEQGVNHIP